MDCDATASDALCDLALELEEVEWLGGAPTDPAPRAESSGTEWLASLTGAIGGATMYFYGL